MFKTLCIRCLYVVVNILLDGHKNGHNKNKYENCNLKYWHNRRPGAGSIFKSDIFYCLLRKLDIDN